MLTTVQPIALAELRPRVRFSFLSHGLRIFLVLIARSSMVPGTARLISLLQKRNKDDHKEISKWAVKSNEERHLYIPQKNTILNKIKKSIGGRINRKVALQERVISQVTIDMGNIGSLLGFVNGMVNRSGASFEERGRTFRPSWFFDSPGLHT